MDTKVSWMIHHFLASTDSCFHAFFSNQGPIKSSLECKRGKGGGQSDCIQLHADFNSSSDFVWESGWCLFQRGFQKKRGAACCDSLMPHQNGKVKWSLMRRSEFFLIPAPTHAVIGANLHYPTCKESALINQLNLPQPTNCKLYEL